MFGRINPDNRAFEWAPVNFMTPDGKTIMNFDLDEDQMRSYGFKQVAMETEPEVGTNQFAVPRYVDKGEYVLQTWEIIDEEIQEDAQ